MQRQQILRAAAIATAATAEFALAQGASAQSSPETPSSGVRVEEVIVTAQKRDEKLQDVPIAVTAFNAGALEKIGFTDMSDLSEKVPSLAISPYPNSGSSLVVFMRGVGAVDAIQPARDPGVGVYLDDVYIARGQALTADLGDIERVEVLRGPQGSLYGRNTIGGAVKFITTKPTGAFGLKASAEVGSFGYRRGLVTLDLPEIAKVSGKVTYLRSTTDGWVDNPGAGGDFGAKDQEGYRLALRWRPLDEVTIDYSYDNARQDGVSLYEQRAYNVLQLGFVFPLQPDRTDRSWRPVDLPIRDDFKASGHALTAAWRVSAALSLKSITAYRELRASALHDTTEAFNLPSVAASDVGQHQFSQEFIASGDLANGGLKYTLGAFYFTEHGGMANAGLANPFALKFFAVPYSPPILADLAPPILSGANNKSSGAYVNLTWTPQSWDRRLSLILGGRYSSDQREAAVSGVGRRTRYSSVDPSFTADYRWTEKLHTYAKYATGYRSGGFNLYNSSLSPFGPERLRSYEVGLKSLWWDDRLQVNVDAYSQRYEAIQLDFVDPVRAGGAGGGIATVNAGRANFRGVEGDFQFVPVRGLTLAANFAYMEAAWAGSNTIPNPFGGLPLFAVSLPNAPRWKYNLSAEYEFPPLRIGRLSALVGYSYRGSETSNGGPGTAGDLRPGYGLFNARVTLSDIPFAQRDVAVSLWANNLADERYQLYHSFGAAIFGEPRSFGAKLSFRY